MLNDAPSYYLWIQVTLYISAKFVSKTIKGVNVRETWYTMSLWQPIKLKSRNKSGEKNRNCRSNLTTLHFSLIQKLVHLNFKFTINILICTWNQWNSLINYIRNAYRNHIYINILFTIGKKQHQWHPRGWKAIQYRLHTKIFPVWMDCMALYEFEYELSEW